MPSGVTESLPSLPENTAPTSPPAPDGLDLQAPELPPPITPREGTTVPEVQVPETGVPAVDGVTGDVEEVTNGLTGALP